jgi:membrane-bound serine protease (ClpP class)
VVDVEMSMMTKILNVIVDPNVAVLLFMAGLLGLYIEFNQPGMLVPGALGAVSLVLAMIAMQLLPFSWVGVLLIVIGIGFFVAELFFTSFGVLFALGVGSLLLGGSMIFERPDVSDLNVSFWPVLVPAVAGMALFAAIVVYAVGRSMGMAQQSGTSELVGMRGRATTDLDPAGTVFLRGEFWRARLAEPGAPLAEGAEVEAVSVEGLELSVKAVETARS